MRFSRLVSAVDVWAAGGPHRIVTGGLPPIKGNTMLAKQQWIRELLPELPSVLTAAPDDHKAMVAAILTEPCDPKADFGVLWMGCGEFMNLCGTGTFAIGTALSEMGLIPVANRVANVVLEIPIGLQELQIDVRDGAPSKVITRTSPAYFERDCSVEIPGYGRIPVQLAFGLNCLEPLIDCGALGIDLVPSNAERLVGLSTQIRQSLQASGMQTSVQLSFFQNHPRDSDADFRNMAVVGRGEVDTTPSGTSTCAQLAARFAKGLIKVGDELKVDSITGAMLGARVVSEASYAGRAAVIPEISGEGRITRLQSIPY